MTDAFKVAVSSRFVVLSVIATCLCAFGVGRVARTLLVDAPFEDAVRAQQTLLRDLMEERMQLTAQISSLDDALHSSANQGSEARMAELPDPVMKDGRIVPHTLYTSKNFDTARSASVSSRWIKPNETPSGAKAGGDDADAADASVCSDDASADGAKQQCSRSSMAASAPTADDAAGIDLDEGDGDDEEHLPAGQHILMDIENVDPAFLDSEERLAIAMLDLVNQCGLTLLSYHCHKLTPTGVTCAGVLLESHVSFHTWPERGVITLDLFTCGPDSLLPVVPKAEALFSIPREPAYEGEQVDTPHVVWAHKLRGFRGDNEPGAEELADVLNYPIGQRLDYKESVATVQTNFQKIEIYDAFLLGKESHEDYEKSIGLGGEGDNTYHMQNPKFFEPDRIVFLDGVLQSRRSGDAAYHEALVHPGLFTHENPTRVAIIGGGEGATLREVLKHNTVEKVVWIEIDKTMVEASTKYLPQWNDCSNLMGSADSCLDDPRVETYYEDAFKWFDDRYPVGEPLADLFDVVIMDALDPQVQVDFVDALYSEGTFLKAISRSLDESGILVAQVGQAPNLKEPAEDHSINKNRMKFILSLLDLDFGHVRNYEESHCGFSAAWEIIVAMKKYDTKADWFDNPAVVNYKIRSRVVPTKDNQVPLHYFDGPTMASYAFPSKQSEVVYCRREPTPQGCMEHRGFDQTRANLPISMLEVKPSSLGENAGRGVFAKEDIPAHSYVGLERLVHTVYVEPSTYDIINSWYKYNHSTFDAEHYSYSLEMYVDAYGHAFSDRGRIHIYSDASIHTFINHGCKSSNNVGHNLTVHESTENAGNDIPAEILKVKTRPYAYNPSTDRKPHFYSSGVPLIDIAQGEELFDNYLGMTGLTTGYWEIEFAGLKAQCDGTDLGYVKYYETTKE